MNELERLHELLAALMKRIAEISDNGKLNTHSEMFGLEQDIKATRERIAELENDMAGLII